MSGHTPGPWHIVGGSDGRQRIYHPDHGPLADLWSYSRMLPEEVGKANVRLIAKAPETAAERDRLKEINAELVEALKGLIDGTETLGDMSDGSQSPYLEALLDQAREARNRAETFHGD